MKNCLVSRLGAWIVLFVLLLVTPAWAHRIKVTDSATAQTVVEAGGQLVADYGSFQLYDIDKLTPGLLADEHLEARDEYHHIKLNAANLDTAAPSVKAARQALGNFTGSRLHLIQFAGPVKPQWHDALLKTGVTIVDYIPENTYLVYGDSKAIAKLQSLGGTISSVQWDGKYEDTYKIHPNAKEKDEKGIARQLPTDQFTIQLIKDAPANAATLAVIDRLKLAPIRRQYEVLHYVNILVRLKAADLNTLAAQPDVISIQLYNEPRKQDERQDQIVAGNLTGSVPSGAGYLAWLAGKGFTQGQFNTSGFIVDMSDSGIDDGTTSPGHFGLYELGDTNNPSRVLYNRLEGTPNTGSTIQGCDGHGNLNTHVVAGYDDYTGFPHTDTSGFHYGLGVCPFVRLGSSVVFDPANFTSPSYPDLTSAAYHDGARVINNSWGSDNNGGYDSDAQAYDALVRDSQPAGSVFPSAGSQEMVIVFSDGDTGPTPQSVTSPSTAKNVISVGGSENVLSLSIANGGNNAAGNDGCTTPDTDANNANDIASFAGRGPCEDGRIKPDLVAPSSHVTGGAPQNFPPPSPTGTGSALPCFLSISSADLGVCALPGSGINSASNFFPVGQQFFTVSSGTSHSAPCVAGACALVRQWFINQSSTPPSPAMTKAYLMNSARYLNGSAANDSLWSNNQGMGELNLGMAFDGVARILSDETVNQKFTASGQTRTFTGTISNNGQPFRVTLAWTDSPGSTTGKALNNDLDLTVTVGGHTYKGNVFNGASSTTGGSADHLNNVESVFLPAGVSGNFSVTITAANINSDGVPGDADSLDQDFALVVYNANALPAPSISANTSVLTSESCTPTNGAIDPGETVTVNFTLTNLGTADTSNLVVTLLATGGVSSPDGPKTYGVIPANGGQVTQPFTFTASGKCGGTITNTFQFQDGSANLGTGFYVFDLGADNPVLNENFDNVATPNLPGDWTSTVTGSQSPWVTSSADFSSSPNAAFANDPASPGVSDLNSPSFTIDNASARLSFRQSYNLEASGVNSTVAYDGAVLEIRIGNKPFTDILKAGGSFVIGGYNRTIASGFGNTLPGRQAWSGISPGFITTIVNLPATAVGQSVQFRWRCSSDSDTDSPGWYIDDVLVSSPSCCGSDNSGSFANAVGTYQGLIDSNSPSAQLSGFVTLKVSKTGGFSGKLTWNDSTYSVKGTFNATGDATVHLILTTGGTLTVTLHLDLSGNSNQLTGSVSDGTATSTVTANRAVFTKTNPANNYLGTYTVLLPPNPDNTGPGFPQGYGYGTVRVDGSGKIKFTGVLGDGTRISQSSVLSQDGQWPVFILPYSKQGVLTGWVAFTNIVGVSDLSGTLFWSKPASASAKFYPEGFETTTDLIGSKFVIPATGAPALTLSNTDCNLMAIIGGGDQASILTNQMTLGANNQITLCTTNGFTLKLTPTKGTFSGSFETPSASKPVSFNGVLLQKQNFGAGTFLDTDQTGFILLEPAP